MGYRVRHLNTQCGVVPLVVGDLLDGKRLDTPPLHQADRTLRKAPRRAEEH
jgi:hypothetical protein